MFAWRGSCSEATDLGGGLEVAASALGTILVATVTCDGGECEGSRLQGGESVKGGECEEGSVRREAVMVMCDGRKGHASQSAGNDCSAKPQFICVDSSAG